MDHYILKYLYDHSNNPKEKRFLDYFKMLLDNRLYSFGMHDTDNFEYKQLKHFEELQQDKGIKALLHPRRRWRKLKERIVSVFESKKSKHSLSVNGDYQQCRYKVLSIFNLRKETIEELNRNEVDVFHYGKPFFEGDVTCDSQSLKALDAFIEQLRYKDFNELLKEENYDTLDAIYRNAVEEFRATDFDAVLVWTSETLECKFIIDVFREIGRPSITLQHGLPGCYCYATESRADYLCVWGPEVRNNFIQVGLSPQKVIVTGNMKYTVSSKVKLLRSDLQDVLVVTTAPFAPHQHEWTWEKFSHNDRNLLITYLYSVERVLKKNNVEHARLRPHPKVNKEWLERFIDTSFYFFDDSELGKSLSRATICIGQTSSTMLEAVRCGVSYLVYEPSEDRIHRMNNELLVPPFDGSKEYLKVAKSEAELDEMIKSRYSPDFELLFDWMQPFNAPYIKKLLVDNCKKGCNRNKSGR